MAIDIPSVYFQMWDGTEGRAVDCGEITYRLVAYYGPDYETVDPAPESVFSLSAPFNTVFVSTDEYAMAGYYSVSLVASSDTYQDAYDEFHAFDIYIGNACETYATQFYPDDYPEPYFEFAFKTVGDRGSSWDFAPMDMWSAVDEHPCGDV